MALVQSAEEEVALVVDWLLASYKDLMLLMLCNKVLDGEVLLLYKEDQVACYNHLI